MVLRPLRSLPLHHIIYRALLTWPLERRWIFSMLHCRPSAHWRLPARLSLTALQTIPHSRQQTVVLPKLLETLSSIQRVPPHLRTEQPPSLLMVILSVRDQEQRVQMALSDSQVTAVPLIQDIFLTFREILLRRMQHNLTHKVHQQLIPPR